MADRVVIPASNKIDKLMCTICLELFRSPRLLPCHHTFCLPCLHDLATRHDNTCFPCPSCRKHATVPAGGVGQFQVNFYLEDDLAEAQNPAAKPQSLQLSQQGKQTNKKPLRLPSTAAESSQHKSRTDSEHHSRQQLVQEQGSEIQTLRREVEQIRTHNRSVKKEQERVRQQLLDKIKNQQKRIQDLESDNRQQRKIEADLRQQNLRVQKRNRDLSVEHQREKQRIQHLESDNQQQRKVEADLRQENLRVLEHQREKQVLKTRVSELEKRLKYNRKHEPRAPKKHILYLIVIPDITFVIFVALLVYLHCQSR